MLCHETTSTSTTSTTLISSQTRCKEVIGELIKVSRTSAGITLILAGQDMWVCQELMLHQDQIAGTLGLFYVAQQYCFANINGGWIE